MEGSRAGEGEERREWMAVEREGEGRREWRAVERVRGRVHGGGGGGSERGGRNGAEREVESGIVGAHAP